MTDAVDISHDLFADGIVNGKTCLQAALDAGYAPKSAQSQGSRLLRNRKVADLIEAKRKAIRERHAVTVERILNELARIGFVDITVCFKEDGTLKDLSQMPEDARRAISAIEVEDLFEGKGASREHIGTLHKIKFNGKIDALRLMGLHLEMFTEKIKHEGLEGKAERLAAARKRAHANR